MQPGSEGTGSHLKKRHIEKQEENGNEKIKNYFIWKSEKVFYLCTPNRKEREKVERRMSRKTGNKKIETSGNREETIKTHAQLKRDDI